MSCAIEATFAPHRGATAARGLLRFVTMFRMRLPLLCVVAVAAGATTASVDMPTFQMAGEGATSGDGRAEPVAGDAGEAGDDEMILIPTTVMPLPGSLGPTDDDGKKGKDKGGGGGGDAPPPPEPTSTVTVPSFWIDAREVSAAGYEACTTRGACTAPLRDDGCTVAAGLPSHPANCVTLAQARTYCAANGKRLVTNDEWTAAAAGASLRPYPWGTEPPDASRLNACGPECLSGRSDIASDGYARTAPRGSFPLGRSPEGVWDLAGNVAEWVELPGGAAVARGGSFADTEPAAVGTLTIKTAGPRDASVSIGFRCARDID
jgi:formylglycine-generating enzyme required for sulfatase activity